MLTHIPGILGDVVQVVPAHDDGAHHLGGLDDTCSAARAGMEGERRGSSRQVLTVYAEVQYRCRVNTIPAPVKIRPRMDTLPVKGHFLST